MIIAGVDIGNASTETALGSFEGGEFNFLASGIVNTTGIKGTRQNIHGVFASMKQAADKAGIRLEDIGFVSLNEAAPVIGDVAMETITETIITESTLIGHNPHTPGGEGIGRGSTVSIKDIPASGGGDSYIVVIAADTGHEEAAAIINHAVKSGVRIEGAIVQKDDAVLIVNRLEKSIPVVDEVKYIERVPLGMPAVVEVARIGGVVEVLSNPYGIATVFGLGPEETKYIVPIARALIGNHSAVVIKTPAGDVTERIIPAGKLHIIGERQTAGVDVEAGAEAIMRSVAEAAPVVDVKGEAGTNVGGMMERVRQTMSDLTGRLPADIKIRDILAVDTFNPQRVSGGVAGEFSMENAVGLAAMVKSDKLQMEMIAGDLTGQIGVRAGVGGQEADMAIRGALTTPGVGPPLAIIDMGAGSTDASIMTKDGSVKSVHLAGAGNMVTLLIQTELGLETWDIAEDVKRYPLARVESLFHIRHEDGAVEFFKDALPAEVFARIILVKGERLFVPLPVSVSIEKVKMVRKEAKEKVFVTNSLRALSMVTSSGNIREIDFVVLVGGSALDFEIPQLVTDALSHYGIVAGRGNVRGTEGPRNAVATGLVLNYRRDHA
ncbi:MAG: diol dehydratase reactivase subunit alpha [Treponema sp.]|jgi:diol dehydratase reactivase alpha subunit|nr:diol dehydratase reactivase subunit alpha [Treponema sp.]